MIICEKLIEGQCVVASDIAGVEVLANHDACKHCLSCDNPKTLNKATASLAAGRLLQNNQFDDSNPLHAEIKQMLIDPTLTRGPGTELKKLISWFPVPGKAKCRTCRNLELKMNRWGPATCELKIDYILKKLQIAAKRRSVPFSRSLVTVLIYKAIRNASK